MKSHIPKVLTTGLFEENSQDKYLNRKNGYWVIKDNKFVPTDTFMYSSYSNVKLMFKEYLL